MSYEINGYDTSHQYNRLVNLDTISWRLVSHLVKSNSPQAERIWKILNYPTIDCLFKPNLTKEEKWGLVYTEDGIENTKRVFLAPFTDDGWTEQCAMIHIFVAGVYPKNDMTSIVDIAVESIIHSKISIVSSNASEENPNSNPSELNNNGELVINYKNRGEVLLRNLIAELNGLFVNGVGSLSFNMQKSSYSKSQQYLWNNRTFYGYNTIFSTSVSGISDTPNNGY